MCLCANCQIFKKIDLSEDINQENYTEPVMDKNDLD